MRVRVSDKKDPFNNGQLCQQVKILLEGEWQIKNFTGIAFKVNKWKPKSFFSRLSSWLKNTVSAEVVEISLDKENVQYTWEGRQYGSSEQRQEVIARIVKCSIEDVPQLLKALKGEWGYIDVKTNK